MTNTKFKRLLAALLSAIVLATALPIQIFAAIWGEGDDVYAAMLGNYIGSDGAGYGDKHSYS